MKSVTLRLLLLLLFFLASGCIPTYRLTDAEVFGPPNHQLPQITMDKQSGDIDVRPYVNILQSDENLSGIIEEDEQTAGFSWDVPDYSSGLNIDLTAGNAFAFNLGATYTSQGTRDFWGGNLGIGVFNDDLPTWAWRVDLGVMIQEMAYRLTYDVQPENGDSSRTEVFRGRDSHPNLYAMFTVNSKVKEWPVNVFLNLGMGNKTFFDVSRSVFSSENTTIRFGNTYQFVSPGLIFDLGGGTHILLGYRRQFERAIEVTRGEDGWSEMYVQLQLRANRR